MTRPLNDAERLAETLAIVCQAFGVPVEPMRAKTRRQEFADPRLAFYHATRQSLRLHPSQVSRWFEARTRGAVIHGAKRASGLLETDPLFRSRVEWVVEQLKQRGIV